MTPKEKAQELVDKFFSNALPDAVECDLNVGKQCALIVVDEILEEALGLDDNDYQSKYDYWEEVKQEIELL